MVARARTATSSSSTGFNSVLFGIGGGPVETSKTVHAIFRRAFDYARSSKPHGHLLRVVSLPSAKFEQDTYDKHVSWLRAFLAGSDNNSLVVLHGFREARPDLKLAAEALKNADILVMPGGSTEQALIYWRTTGLERLIKAAVQRGLVIIGHSAGLIAWFAQMDTDSDSYGKPKGEPWSYKISTALGLLPFWICPHAADNARKYTYNPDYGAHETRRDDFIGILLVQAGVAGIAVDSDTAIKVDGPAGTISVIGDGEVTTHKRVGRCFTSTVYTDGDQFSFADLSA